jgi:hypothetical protein
MNHWQLYLIDHYTGRLAEETRPEARAFLRQTLTNLKKDVEPTSSTCNSSISVVNSVFHHKTKPDWATI